SFTNAAPSSATYTLSLHDALPILVHLHAVRHVAGRKVGECDHLRRVDDRHHVHAGMVTMKIGIRDEGELAVRSKRDRGGEHLDRSAEHTSELQSREEIACSLLHGY